MKNKYETGEHLVQFNSKLKYFPSDNRVKFLYNDFSLKNNIFWFWFMRHSIKIMIGSCSLYCKLYVISLIWNNLSFQILKNLSSYRIERQSYIEVNEYQEKKNYIKKNYNKSDCNCYNQNN